jgi:predicted ATP-grasp superfamily ATP-dependent carboligase
VIDLSLRLLRSAEWSGVAEVEYILDEKGEPRLLEVNPRFWSPVALAIGSGVDFPSLLYDLSMGRTPEKVLTYEEGKTFRWFFPYELMWLAWSPGKFRSFTKLFKFRNVVYGIFKIKDPAPMMGAVVQSIGFFMDSEKRKMVLSR